MLKSPKLHRCLLYLLSALLLLVYNGLLEHLTTHLLDHAHLMPSVIQLVTFLQLLEKEKPLAIILTLLDLLQQLMVLKRLLQLLYFFLLALVAMKNTMNNQRDLVSYHNELFLLAHRLHQVLYLIMLSIQYVIAWLIVQQMIYQVSIKAVDVS